MTTTAKGGQSHLGSLPQQSPEFSNLEIRGTWTGDANKPVDLRISLEVRCVPNTQLQLLSTRSADISLVKTFSVRLQSNEWGQGNQSSGSSPQSPLFAFSAPVSDDGDKDPPACSPGTSARKLSTTAKEPFTGYSDETTPLTESSIGFSDSAEIDPSSLSFSPPKFSSGMHLNVARCADWINMQNLVKKRSAADACLTDSGSDSEQKQTPSRKPSAKSTVSNTVSNYSSAESAPEPDQLTQTPSKGRNLTVQGLHQSPTRPLRGRHSRNHSMIPKRVSRLDKDVVKQAAPGSALEHTSAIVHDEKTSEEGDFPTPTKATIIQSSSEKGEDHGSFGSETTKATSGSSEATGSSGTELTDITKSDSAQSTLDLAKVLDGLLIDLESDEELTTNFDKRVDPESPSPPPGEGINAPQAPVSKGEDTRSTHANGHKHHTTCDCENCQSTTSEPQLELDDGILFIRNPANVRAATYRLAITASVLLEKGKSKGWSNLVIPGLPRMRAGESGLFLFRIPENHGLEFRTTNLQRYKIVENCFVAEFANHGDLVVPLRVCDQKFYGIVKDFTVDQEIRADHTVVTSVEEEGKGIQANVVVKYTAMCSLRLHNRCFWAEKCCFFLRLDGGPRGCFRSQLETQKTDLQVIHLLAENDAIDVSHIQVICSPRDMEIFGVTWEVKLPGQQVINWLPRIYPVSSTSCESNKSYLRHVFNELDAGHRKEIEHASVRIPEVDDGDNSACETQDSAEKSNHDNNKHLDQPAELPSEEVNSPIETESPVVKASIANSVVGFTYWKACLIIGLYVSAVWISVFFSDPNYLNAFNTALNKIGLDIPFPGIPENLNFSGGDPNYEDQGFGHDLMSERNIVNILPESPGQRSETGVVDDQDVGHAQAGPDEVVNAPGEEFRSTPASPVDQPVFSLRDRIDYWLGWKGPIGNEF